MGMFLTARVAQTVAASSARRLLAQPTAQRMSAAMLCSPLHGNALAWPIAKRSFAAEPMENFGELSEFMEVIMAGPEKTPAWLKEFDTKPIGITVKFKAKPEHRNTFVKAMKRHQKVTIQQEGVVAVPHFKLHTSPFDDHVFYLVEEWASAKALKKHYVADYMGQLVEEMKVFLVPSSESQIYVALYGLGFEERNSKAA